MSDAPIPPALDAELRRLAAEAAGQPLTESLGPGSPLAALMGRFVEIALEEELTAHLGSPPGTRAPGSPLSIYAAGSDQTQPAVEIPLGDGGLQLSTTAFATIFIADVPDGQGGETIGSQAVIEDAPPDE
jgi:hypothetical protein